MGRYLIFIVLAAVVGAATLTLSSLRSRQATDQRHAEGQADVLAREIAEAGQNAALSAMLSPAGFVDPTTRLGAGQDYAGGRFSIEYTPVVAGAQATVTVQGIYGGAVHTTERTYAREPLTAPGPLWLDVPQVTSTFTAGATIAGGPAVLDRRDLDASGLIDLIPLALLEADLDAKLKTIGSSLSVPAASAWDGAGSLTSGLNVDDAEALYQRAVAAKGAGDVTMAGSQTVAGSVTWGLASEGDKITHVDGDLTVTGRIRGNGALVVGGALRVPKGGELDWNGLVIVRSTADVLPVDLAGKVSIDGMTVVAHTPSIASAVARALVLAGAPYGTELAIGKDVTMRYAIGEIRKLTEKMGFDSEGARLLASSSSHVTAAEARGLPPGSPTGPSPPPPPTCTVPGQMIQFCNKPGGKSPTWYDREELCTDYAVHLTHGCLHGTCASRGVPPSAPPLPGTTKTSVDPCAGFWVYDGSAWVCTGG